MKWLIIRSMNWHILSSKLQEAIVASFITLQTPHNFSAQDHQIQSSIEIGEPPQISCKICAERKENDEMFPLQSCSHKFCKECISKHTSLTIKKRTTILNQDITCPGLDCKGKLIINECTQILSKDVLIMWEDAIFESRLRILRSMVRRNAVFLAERPDRNGNGGCRSFETVQNGDISIMAQYMMKSAGTACRTDFSAWNGRSKRNKTERREKSNGICQKFVYT